MRSSLPHIFRKNSLQLTKPEKQSPEYSLFIRTNNFKPQNDIHPSNRYNKSSTRKINRSLNYILDDNLKINSDHPNLTQRKGLFSKRNNSQIKSNFIQQNQNPNAEEVDSCKTIRKRVMQEINILQKSMQIVQNMEKSIKNDIQKFKQTELENLCSFQAEMKKSIANFRITLKTMKKQIHSQIKVNKEQVTFLQEQINNFKHIYEGFQTYENKCRFDIMNTTKPSQKEE